MGEFNNLPQLKKRAIVEFVAKKGPEAESSSFNVDGNLFKTAVLRMEIDGYTSPVTAGNFVDLVNKGFYDGMRIQRSDGFVVQTGDPSKEGRGDGKINGYVPEGKEKVRTVPLEVFVKNDKAPIYGSTFDDDGRGATRPPSPSMPTARSAWRERSTTPTPARRSSSGCSSTPTSPPRARTCSTAGTRASGTRPRARASSPISRREISSRARRSCRALTTSCLPRSRRALSG